MFFGAKRDKTGGHCAAIGVWNLASTDKSRVEFRDKELKRNPNFCIELEIQDNKYIASIIHADINPQHGSKVKSDRIRI
jgi:hypothetical protein